MKNTTLLFFFFLIGCRDIDAPMRAPNLQSPVVTGINLTDDMGREMGIWGRPSDKTGNMSMGIFLAVYPNPSDGVFVIRYDLMKAAHVKMWAVRARTDDELNDKSFGGSTLFAPDDLALRILVDQYKETGHYAVEWRRDSNITEGFYRIYLESNDHLIWRDVAVFEPCNLPLDLQKFFNFMCD